MADSVDRVFVHALNTVKRIPRLGSARPPPSDRLKLYGLYKQSMEGDVDAVMDRPDGDSDEIKSDQEKWDAWNHQKGLSKTEAKRLYISTLIDTMHKYASQTPDAKELVSELEFVWDQIKSNPPSTSSSNSYPQPRQDDSPTSTNDQLIYPVMSARGSRNPRANVSDNNGLRVMSPVSHDQAQAAVEREDGLDEAEREAFVDAPDSQAADNEERSPLASPGDEPEQDTKGGIVAPLAKYIRQRKEAKDKSSKEDSLKKWNRRIESALIKMNAEIAALREQLDMQQSGSVHSSMLPSFNYRRRRAGVLQWILDTFMSSCATLIRHMIVDAALVILLTLLIQWRGKSSRLGLSDSFDA